MRLARLLGLAALVAAIATGQSLADDSTPAPATTTTTTTVAQPAAPAPKSSTGSKTTRSTFHVNTIFPAAGQLLVNSVSARVSPNPHARVIKVMHMFREDYRTQEILALSTTLGSDGKAWYRISVPMRPNGMKGWIPARSVNLAPTVSQIVIDRGARTIDIFWKRKHALHATVAVLRGGPLRPVPGPVPRRLRRRDERLLEAHRVARRGRRRHPRHEHAPAARAGGLARLRACLEHDGGGDAEARTARHADLDQGLKDASVRRARSPSAARNEPPLWPLRARRVDELLIW